MSYQNFTRMINNETRSIRYDNIEALCALLDCTPNDLFRFTEDPPPEEQGASAAKK